MSIFYISEGISQEIGPVIIGEWKLDYNSTYSRMSEESRTNFLKLPSLQQEKIRKLYEGRTFSFNSSGDYRQVLSDGKMFEGNWFINNQGVLEIKKDSAILMSYKIELESNSI
ncbi:hypothetical protein [Aestuariibaculum sediminum]|uniref:Lipocalin-like domain-containing protein n=1 Tax=Aestuariibaculum sediminum TaxID=2770637 RepID=A0A8J6U7V9_9FLAO|nr:hypothetical protein [Aestuariibaculum sediminum]MBD0832530.1 hypothetical protein [Aestuariibaculum sediminum]